MTRIFACDFETTVYKGQKSTEVWASACVELYTEDVIVFHSIEEQFNYFNSLKQNITAYYHNLKFDGNFWLWYLLYVKRFKQAYVPLNDGKSIEWLSNKDMPPNSVKYSISDRGMWYTITIKTNNNIIEMRDSYKLLPFSLRKIGKDFNTKHKKLEMEYTGFRYAGCNITDEEKEYIKNDVLVLKEALEIMFNDGHKKLTIGSCCLEEFKKSLLMGAEEYKVRFPDLTQVTTGIPNDEKNADAWIRHSYKGGWCYLVKEKANKLYNNGVTADVNSLYPSMMHSMSGNYYPVGLPRFWTGNYIPDFLDIHSAEKFYFFVRIKCRFYLKSGMLPFIQIKGNYLYNGTDSLTTSDIYNRKTGEYSRYYKDIHGNIKDSTVELTLTMTDYLLFIRHYEVVDMEILSGCYFRTDIGIFDDYIDKYKKIKEESTGAKRAESKLFLNNLYGKMATNTDSSFKVAYIKDDNSLGFFSVEENNKKAGYIPIGSAITSYARNFTITHAQLNYHGTDKRGFIYADTDSIHCDLPPEEIKGIKVHPTNFCAWKLESGWDIALFVRQKTYIEHVIAKDLKEIDEPFYDIKCAGMPDKCKDLFLRSVLQNTTKEEFEKMDKETQDFIKEKREITDFKVGLKVPKKLLPKRIMGGVLLTETTYEMR